MLRIGQMLSRRLARAAGLMIWLLLVRSTAAAPVLDSTHLQNLLQQHCIECHDSSTKKGELDLTTLGRNVGDPAVLDRWVRVFDRVQAGEMPPEKKPRPAAAELAAAMGDLGTALREASRHQQMAAGRVIGRRLNRAEYENTLRDGFQMPFLDVRELLPPDSQAFGFDNVAQSLMLSPVQIGAFLETGELALRSAMMLAPRPEPKAFHYAWTNVYSLSNHIAWMRMIPPYAVQIRQQTPPYGWFDVVLPSIHVPGHYHVKAKIFGATLKDNVVGPADRKHSVLIHLGAKRLGSFDLNDDLKTPLEFDTWWEPGENFTFTTVTLDPTTPEHLGGDRRQPWTGPAILFESWEMNLLPVQEWPPESYRVLFGDLPVALWNFKGPLAKPSPVKLVTAGHPERRYIVKTGTPEADARQRLRAFMEHFWRKPVPDGAEEPYLDLVRRLLAQNLAFQEAMLPGFQAILASPDFLFFDEKPGPLDDWALASRLSYFLVKSAPDATLRQLAAAGELHRPDVLRAQVDRLLAAPESGRFLDEFLGQWLDLRRLDDTQPDPKLYPEFDVWLRDSMPRETTAFFRELLARDLGADQLVKSDFVMVNQRLAALYGLPGVEGDAFRRVPLPKNSLRGGLLAQAAILKVTANGTTTSPVVRGNWVRSRLLGRPVPPPPAGIGSVDPDTRGATTIREQLDKHRHTPACATCHTKIDPPGFALETFDVIGGWRDRYRSLEIGDDPQRRIFFMPAKYRLGPAVDTAGVTEQGQAFRGFSDFRERLLDEHEQIARNLTQQLVIFATGAGVQFADRDEIEAILRRAKSKDWGVRTLIHEIVASPLFLNQ